jgi:glycosyltransferase involved in cell wall biosynthesis
MFAESLAYCDRVVTITQYNRDLLVEKFGVPADEIDIVRQIVDLEEFKYVPKIKVLIVGFFAHKKGHDVLFEAVKQMNRDDIEVWVVGDKTPDRGRSRDLPKLARELGVDHQIAFFSEQKGVALRALYRECDIFCLPSRTDYAGSKEGFPNVIMEAMAFGKPVVSTRHAGIPDVVDQILVDENDATQLAEALNRICDSPELRREFGEKNREKAERLFSHANNDRLEEILLRYSRRAEPRVTASQFAER